MADIFLSYAREDLARARLLAEALESQGWSVWWDRRILHGQDFTDHIQEQLDAARCIVVLWSKVSAASKFVRDEATEGLNNGRLVPLLLEVVKPPLGFRQLHAADLTDWTGGTSHDEFTRLVHSIGVILSRTTTANAVDRITADRRSDGASLSSNAHLTGQFEFDAYISYAHLDNVELLEGRRGWVSNFRRGLEIRLGQLLGRQPHVFMNPKLDGRDFGPDTGESLRHVAAFVPVISPRYVKSEWAMRELKEFWKAAEKQGGVRVDDKARVFKVMKTPVPMESQPPELQELLGYEFFRVDPETGRVRELDEVFGPEAQRDFWLRLDDMAHNIATLLEELERRR